MALEAREFLRISEIAREGCSELFNLVYKVNISLKLDTRYSRELQRAVSCISGGMYLLNDIVNNNISLK